jgi:AcrR family transcriptional regulator
MSARSRRPDAPTLPGEDAKARIEDVATRLFIRDGYNGVSYLDIGRELGISHSSIHYYFRTKDLLAEATLRRVADATLSRMKRIWTDPDTTLFEKLVAVRDSIHAQYLEFNPNGKGGRPWGLISRFTVDADSLSPAVRKLIRQSIERLDEYIATGVRLAVEHGELDHDTPQASVSLQIASLMSATGQLTRRGSGFDRLHELLRWTYVVIVRAYGRDPQGPRDWPALREVSGTSTEGRAPQLESR